MSRTFVDFHNGVTISSEDVILSSLKVGDDDLDLDPKRTTSGKLFRNRVAIPPYIEFELKPLPQAKMVEIMNSCRRESFNITFWYPAAGGYYNADVYCPPNYRKPSLLMELPVVMFDKHTLKFTGMHKMSRVRGD